MVQAGIRLGKVTESKQHDPYRVMQSKASGKVIAKAWNSYINKRFQSCYKVGGSYWTKQNKLRGGEVLETL